MEEGRENLSKSDSEGGAGVGEMGSRTVVRETDGGRGEGRAVVRGPEGGGCESNAVTLKREDKRG